MFIVRLIKSLLSFVYTLLRIVLGIIGAALLLIFILWFFLNELPLGPVPAVLASPSGGPYIDMHVHVAGVGAGGSGCYISPNLLNSYKYYFYLSALNTSDSELKAFGDSIVIKKLSATLKASKQIKKAVILALDGVVDAAGNLDLPNTEIYVPNEYVAAEVGKYDNLLYGASVNPYRTDALARLIAAKKAGAVLIKWLPSIMNIDPADEKLTPFYLALVELDLPLLSHTGSEASFTQARNEFADPLRLELPLKLGVKVIAAHIATTGENEGQENFERILPLFAKYPNLYTDISSLTQINKLGYLEKALQKPELKGRMIYGSDWPLQFFPLTSPWYHYPTIKPAAMRFLFNLKNEFERDVLLKKAMGVPEDVFTRTEELLMHSKSLDQIVSQRTAGTKPSPSLPIPAHP